MASKSTDWRPGPTVCRCCLSEGCYKDISTEYFWMGKREVYAEMLLDSFNLSIAYSQSGGPNSNSRLICEPCISRLRDASEFKRQVQECEKTFMQYLDPGSTAIIADLEAPLETLDSQVKVEKVKLEKQLSDVDDFEDRPDFIDDDDDDLDDQPLTTFATKIPKKESVDLLDLLDNAKAGEKRKSSSKSKTSPAKKAKTKKETPKPTSSKTIKPEKKKKEISPMSIARRNAEKLVLLTTAYPFKIPECSLVCVYCREEFTDPSAFRQHMKCYHTEVNLRVAFSHVPDGYIKLDCTELSCRICSKTVSTIEMMADHLMKVHNKQMSMDHDLGIQPFAFRKDFWSCYICNVKFSTLRSLSRHTQSHYMKYTCESCGKSYFNMSSLQHHVRFTHVNGLRICIKCKNTFKTLEAKKKHVEETPSCWPFRCKTCGDRFVTCTLKDAHRASVHGERSRSYECPECKEVFPNRMKYRFHFIIAHTDDYFVCGCGRKFDSKNNLEKHKVVHTKEKLFSCTVCSKEFSRKKNLVQHMWIHSEVKRFECVPCKKKFNQKVTWKIHMKARHPDVNIS